MLEDALASDQLLAMALLQPGWEAKYDGCPEVCPMACVGRVVSHTRLADGRYNLLLLGSAPGFDRPRVAGGSSVSPGGGGHPGRPLSGAGQVARARTQRALLREFQRCLRRSLAKDEPLEQLLSRQLPLGVLTDIVGFTVKFDIPFKQKLLSEWNVDVAPNCCWNDWPRGMPTSRAWWYDRFRRSSAAN